MSKIKLTKNSLNFNKDFYTPYMKNMRKEVEAAGLEWAKESKKILESVHEEIKAKLPSSFFKKIEIKRAKNNGELVSSGYIKNENFWDWIKYQHSIKKDWTKFREYYAEMIKKKWAQFNSIEDYTNEFMKENLTDQNTLIITHDTTLIPILYGINKYNKDFLKHYLE